MPLTSKGKDVMGAMMREYGSTKGKSVFYASMNKGKIKGVEGNRNSSDAEHNQMRASGMIGSRKKNK